MLQILRGLCVACDAEGMPLLKIFSGHAREALQEGSRPVRHVMLDVPPEQHQTTGNNTLWFVVCLPDVWTKFIQFLC